MESTIAKESIEWFKKLTYQDKLFLRQKYDFRGAWDNQKVLETYCSEFTKELSTNNQSTPYNDNHSQDREELDYNNLSKKKRLQIDLTFSYIDNVNKDKRIETLESRINKAIEILEPSEENIGVVLMALKSLRGDLN